MTKFMKFLSKKILTPSCAIFTSVYFLILCFANLTSKTEQAITLKNSAVILLFALLLSLCDLIFAHKKMNLILKIVFHFAAVFASAAFISKLAGYDFTGRAYLMIILFIFVYALICPFYILIGKKYKQNS